MECVRDPRRALLKSLQKQTVVVPDLEKTLCRWPSACNPAVDALAAAVEVKLEGLFKGKRLDKMKAADAAGFAAQWWPYAPLDRLLVLAFLSIWLFAWDDETDSIEYSDLSDNFPKAQAFRKETIDLIQSCLESGNDLVKSTHPIIDDFRWVGTRVVRACTKEQTQYFLDQLKFFVEMSEVEQEYQALGILPTVEEYLHRRMGSSAVGVCLALSEYALGIELPSYIQHDEDLEILRHETNVIISVANDILSAKKEIAQRQLDSLIPLLYAQERSLQSAMDVAAGMVQTSVSDFDAALNRLQETYAHDESALDKVGAFADSCKFACTANLRWSLSSGRYCIGSSTLAGGLSMQL